MAIVLRTACLLLVLAALPACGTLEGYKFIQESDLAALAPGRSTRADVQKLLGRPFNTTGAGSRDEVWEYHYAANTESMLLWVFFDAGGTIKQVQSVLPRLYQREPPD